MPGTLRDAQGQTMKAMIHEYLGNGKGVWLVGHSKGGAIAATAAARLMCCNHTQNLHLLTVVTFNAPPAVGKEWVDECSALVTESKVLYRRFEERGDLVRKTDLVLGCGHIGVPEYFGRPFTSPVAAHSAMTPTQEDRR